MEAGESVGLQDLIFFATCTRGVATLLSPSLGVLAPFIRRDMALSAVEVGALFSAAFLAAAVGSPHVGRLTDMMDRGGRRR